MHKKYLYCHIFEMIVVLDICYYGTSATRSDEHQLSGENACVHACCTIASLREIESGFLKLSIANSSINELGLDTNFKRCSNILQ